MVGNVDLPEDHLAAFGLDQAESLLAMCGRTSGNDDDGTFAREGDRDGTPMPWPDPVTMATLRARRVPMAMSLGQAASSMTMPLASKPWLARSSCCE
jgi:hypothetical protein